MKPIIRLVVVASRYVLSFPDLTCEMRMHGFALVVQPERLLGGCGGVLK